MMFHGELDGHRLPFKIKYSMPITFTFKKCGSHRQLMSKETKYESSVSEQKKRRSTGCLMQHNTGANSVKCPWDKKKIVNDSQKQKRHSRHSKRDKV